MYLIHVWSRLLCVCTEALKRQTGSVCVRDSRAARRSSLLSCQWRQTTSYGKERLTEATDGHHHHHHHQATELLRSKTMRRNTGRQEWRGNDILEKKRIRNKTPLRAALNPTLSYLLAERKEGGSEWLWERGEDGAVVWQISSMLKA